MTCRVAIVFPGQGSQRREMLADAPETEGMERLLDAAEALTGLDLRRIEAEGPDEALADTRAAQPLLYLTGWAWGTALLDAGCVPCALAGHSLGELAALAVAGAYSVEAGLELVVERSRLMAAACERTPGAMAAVIGLTRQQVEDTIASIPDVWVANDNSPAQTVISGTEAAVATASQLLQAAGARRVVRLPVSGAFHSPLMADAARAFAEVLSRTEFNDAAIPVVQNTAPTPETRAEVLRARLADQMLAPVRWTETMRELAADGPCTVVEVGPGSVLTGLARSIEGIRPLSVEKDGVELVLEEVA